MSNAVVQARVVTSQSTIAPGQSVVELALFNPNGTPYTGGGITAQQAVDAVKSKTQIVAVTSVTAANAALAAGATPTKAEYDILVAEANATKAQLNALIAAIKA